MKLFFIRHAESIKSLEYRHGGKGQPLTEQGKKDIFDIISFLEKNENVEFDNIMMYCSDRIQVIETAKIIASQKKIAYQIENDIRNINLGVLDGLSDKEALERFPTEATNLQKWRDGTITIGNVSIPNSETMEQFYERIFRFISSKVSQEKDVIVIGTRSVGVAIANIFDNYNKNIDFNSYKRYTFDPSSISKYEYEENSTKIDYINKTDFLLVKPHYPDD